MDCIVIAIKGLRSVFEKCRHSLRINNNLKNYMRNLLFINLSKFENCFSINLG